MYRKQKEEEERITDQRDLLAQYQKKVEERKRLNEIQKAVDQSVKDVGYRDGANLSADLRLLQDLEIQVSKSFGPGKKSRDATFERKRTDAVAKSIKRE